jgi:mono/diheme cytochrome c family protein
MACRRVVLTTFSATFLAAIAMASQGPPSQALPPLVIESVAGKDNFDRYCAPCHGRDGRGAGPVSSALRTQPADLTSLARRNDGHFPHDRVVAFVTGTGRDVAAHGSADMPVWGPIFRGLDPSDDRVRQRIDNVVTFIESLQVPSTGVSDPGSRLFRTHCAACHGATGRGDGPMADQLRRTPPDLTQVAARNGGVFPSERVRAIIDGRGVPSHGDREMPVWGEVFKDVRDGRSAETVKARIAAIVRYLEGIQERTAKVRPMAPGDTVSVSIPL